jgi:hypothetical protein
MEFRFHKMIGEILYGKVPSLGKGYFRIKIVAVDVGGLWVESSLLHLALSRLLILESFGFLCQMHNRPLTTFRINTYEKRGGCYGTRIPIPNDHLAPIGEEQ